MYKEYMGRQDAIVQVFLKFLTGCEIFFGKVLTLYILHDILINVADAETQQTTKKKLKNLVDIEKRRC